MDKTKIQLFLTVWEFLAVAKNTGKRYQTVFLNPQQFLPLQLPFLGPFHPLPCNTHSSTVYFSPKQKTKTHKQTLPISSVSSPTPTMVLKTLFPSLCLVACALQGTEAFSSELSRRQAVAKTFNTVAGGIATTVVLPNVVNAEISEETARVVTRMGGLLVR